LFGRVTYDMMASFWPTPIGKSANPVFADALNNTPKIVFSTTLEKGDWQNTTIISKNIVEEIHKLKEQSGQNILVAGSGKLVHTLMQQHLVDEFRCMVHPVVLGSGKRLFPEGTEKFQLTLVETKAFKTGIVVLHYQPERGQ